MALVESLDDFRYAPWPWPKVLTTRQKFVLMKRITQLVDLSYEELKRVRQTLLRRYHTGKRSNILEVSFGIAEKAHQLDYKRRDSAIFYVQKKKNPKRKSERLPETVSVRLRRGNQFVSVQLATDVVEFGRRARLSGKRIYFRGNSRSGGTAGCVVVWKQVGTQRFRWGVLTVSHIMPRGLKLPEVGTSVLLTGPLARQQGKLLALSVGTGLDAALVQVSRLQLQQSGIIQPRQTTTPLKIRPRDTLAHDRGATGFTRPQPGPIPITVQSFTPIFTLLEDEIGTLTDVVQVSAKRGAFVKGTSGSLWSIKRQVACMQFGQIGNSSRGLGQPLEQIVEWAATSVARIARIDHSQIDFRVVSVI